MHVAAKLYEPDPRLLVLAAIALGGWYLVAAGIILVRWPKTPDPDPPTNDLRPETPAVANLLTHGWLADEDSLAATLLDLAARDFVTIEDRGDGVLVCKLHTGRGSGTLRPYEKRILEHLARSEKGGVVPAGALTTGTKERSKRWWKSFRKEVAEDARAAGLARQLWPVRLSALLFALGVPIYLLLAAAQDFRDAEEVQTTPLLEGITYAMWAGVILLLVLAGTSRMRDTAAGRTAAAHWLGVKRNLRTLPSFPDLSPAAVVTWERHLAYGAALGVAGRAVKSLPLGAERDRRAWTNYGGEWRSVQVRYPRFRLGWGSQPMVALLLGLVRIGFAVGALALLNALGLSSLPVPAAAAIVMLLIAIALWSLVGLAWAVMDMTRSTMVTGEILRTRVKSRLSDSPSEDGQDLYFVAVYPGEGDKVLAWRVSSKLYPSFAQGQVITAQITPRLAYVKNVAGGTVERKL